MRFETKVTDLIVEHNQVTGVMTEDGTYLQSKVVILAIGHSARDTFAMLEKRQIPMEAKAFAVGLRMEHPRGLIDQIQYGKAQDEHLPAASYKVPAKTAEGYILSACVPAVMWSTPPPSREELPSTV